MEHGNTPPNEDKTACKKFVCFPGILFASGPVWKYLRRFTLKTLRDFGFGKAAAETMIMDECSYMTEYLR